MEKTEFEPFAADEMDKCATIYRKDPSSFVYVCYHCGASFSDIDSTLQHVESHSQLVHATNDLNNSSTECKDSENSTNTHLDTYNTRHITDTIDTEIDIKTEVMDTEDDCSEYSLDDNILDIADFDFDIKMEAMDDEEENAGRCTPNELIQSARIAGKETLPATSKERYDKMYHDFKKWQTSKKAARISHTVLMAFFHELAQMHKPTTLWAYYSMLKATIKINENIDISSYHQLNAFLKKKASGYKPVKANVFSEADIRKFIDEAPDELWLDVKVVCIFRVTGACSAHELPRITLNDIESHGELLLVRILKSNDSVIDRSFTITGKFRTIVQKYAALRTPEMQENRFFLNYQRGKCTRQVIGKNKLANMPRRIATYLQLPELERFTGLSFRKTSATIVAKNVANMDILSHSGTWQSNAMADVYAEDSIHNENRTAEPVANTMTSTSSKASISLISQDVIKVEDTVDTMDEENSNDSELPIDFVETAKCASLEGLPETSKLTYMNAYHLFEKWQNEKQIQTISEEVIVAYMNELSKKVKPTTLWAYYSMLKATLRAKQNVDISNFHQVVTFLKSQSSGYKPVKANVFSEADIRKFIEEAPDQLWLDVKVVCIFGVTGACRINELPQIKVTDIESHGELLLVRILKSNRATEDRCFTITGKYRQIVQKYAAMRTSDMTEDRFLVNYQRGKCTRQFIGKNKLSHMPRRIAKYLQLPEPERFTGLSFMKTSATMVANTDFIQLSGSVLSKAVADKYVDNSIQIEKQADDLLPSTIIAAMKAPMNVPINVPTNVPMNAAINLPMNVPINVPINVPMNVPNAPSSRTFTFSISENVMKVINISTIDPNDEQNTYGIFGK